LDPDAIRHRLFQAILEEETPFLQADPQLIENLKQKLRQMRQADQT
jgi:hypothetical protein